MLGHIPSFPMQVTTVLDMSPSTCEVFITHLLLKVHMYSVYGTCMQS